AGAVHARPDRATTRSTGVGRARGAGLGRRGGRRLRRRGRRGRGRLRARGAGTGLGGGTRRWLQGERRKVVAGRYVRNGRRRVAGLLRVARTWPLGGDRSRRPGRRRARGGAGEDSNTNDRDRRDGERDHAPAYAKIVHDASPVVLLPLRDGSA